MPDIIPLPDLGQTPQQQALARYKPLLSNEQYVDLMAELDQPLFPSIRVNRLKVDPAAAVQQWAEQYQWDIRPIPFCDTGWWVTKSPDPVSLPVEHRLGSYYIQDAASMLPVSLFDIDSEDCPLILDMAASPGGKTTHLVDRTLDRGLVLANDSSRDRITMLRMVLQNWGALNTAVTRFPGEKFGSWYPDTFDCVLLDAPCSMQNLRSTEARPMQAISDREREMLAGRQNRLLMSALQAVKVGGQVVYATCTLDPDEDEAVLDSVLRSYGKAVQIVDVSQLLVKQAPGLLQAEIAGEELAFQPQVQNAVRLWPHIFNTSGFFAALLTKCDNVGVEKQLPPQVSQTKRTLKPLKSKESRGLVERLQQTYGFDFSAVMQTQGLSLWRNQNVLYTIPDAWWDRFSGLPFQAVGMRVAEESNELVPSHEWVARFGMHFQNGVYQITSAQGETWLKGEDLPNPDLESAGTARIVAVRDASGRLYGRGKLLKNRLRNLLPSRLVYF